MLDTWEHLPHWRLNMILPIWIHGCNNLKHFADCSHVLSEFYKISAWLQSYILRIALYILFGNCIHVHVLSTLRLSTWYLSILTSNAKKQYYTVTLSAKHTLDSPTINHSSFCNSSFISAPFNTLFEVDLIPSTNDLCYSQTSQRPGQLATTRDTAELNINGQSVIYSSSISHRSHLQHWRSLLHHRTSVPAH